MRWTKRVLPLPFLVLLLLSACGGDGGGATSGETSNSGQSAEGSTLVSGPEVSTGTTLVPVQVDPERTRPSFNETDVPIETDITVVFTKGVEPLSGEDFVVTTTEGTPVAGRITQPNATTARFTPDAPLAPETGYRFTIATSVVATDGAPFDQVPETPEILDPFMSVFTTGLPPCQALPPDITGITPGEGPLTGGQEVTIRGHNFLDAGEVSVTFDTEPATIVEVLADTIIAVTPPARDPGPVNVFVNTCAGSDFLVDGYVYLVPPEITALSITKGTTKGGDLMVISGSGFTSSGDTTILFGETQVPRDQVSVLSPEEIRLLTPPAELPGAVDVTMINSIGTAVVPQGFLYLFPPSLQIGSVVINEVVTEPVFDWNDTDSGDGIPFNEIPGTGNASNPDEWIELKNVTDKPVDLRGWSLLMIDTDPREQPLEESEESGVVLRFSAGNEAAFPPGAYLVVGNPAGEMGLDVWVILRDAEGNVVDDVEIGDVPVKPPDGDGAPEGRGSNGFSTDITTEAIARLPDGADSDPNEEDLPGVDPHDFVQRSATIGSSNSVGMSTPGAVVINEVVIDPQADWSDSVGGRGVPFDNKPGSGVPNVEDQWIELYNTSEETIDLTNWSVLMRDNQPDKEILSPENPKLVFSEGSSATAFLPGGYCVIGNPSGLLDQEIFIELKDAAGQRIDTLEIGDDFERDGDGDGAPQEGRGSGTAASTSPVDEAIARFPNGTDSDPAETNENRMADQLDFRKRSATILTSNDEGDAEPGEIVVNEVVTDPQTDWNGEGGVGCRPGEEVPFDSKPCTGVGGTINANDQYVELFNKGNRTIKINGLHLYFANGQFGTIENYEYLHLLGTDLVEPVLYFSNPQDAVQRQISPGHFLVVGNPEGILQNKVFVELRDGFGQVIDNVEIGDNPEGDLPDDGTIRGGDANGDPGIEAVQRDPNGVDSDPDERGVDVADVNDFTKRPGTPGRINISGAFPVPGDVVINEVVTDPQNNWSENGFNGDPGRGRPTQGEDEFVELLIKKAGLNLSDWRIEVHNDPRDVTAVDFAGKLDAEDIVSRAFETSNYVGRGSFENTEAGDYLVLGNPSLEGVMGNNCFIVLRDAQGNVIDDVEIGDDPENDGEGDGAPQGQPGGGVSNNSANEAVARIPNGFDSDDDFADFVKQAVTMGKSNESRP